MAQRDGLNTRERRLADPPQLPDPGVFPPFNRSHTASQGNPSQKFCTKITILLFHNDKQTTVLTKHYSKQSFAVSQLTTASSKEQHKELVCDTWLKHTGCPVPSTLYRVLCLLFVLFCFVLPFQRRNKTLLLSEAADC